MNRAVLAPRDTTRVSIATSPAVAEAWNDYLQTIRATGYRYEEVEPWAWARLQTRLEFLMRKPAEKRRTAKP